VSPDAPGLLEALAGSDRVSIPELFAARVEASPDRLFLIHEGRQWTYAEAWEEILSVAAFLRASGVDGPEARIAGYLPHSPAAIWAWLGTLASGGVYVPLNRGHRRELLADLVARSGATLVISDADGAEMLPDHRSLRHVLLDIDGPGRAACASDARGSPSLFAPAFAEAGSVAEIMFTSGSTGPSKGARVTHNQITRGAARFAASIGLNEDDRFHAWSPVSHIFGQLHMTMASIVAGGSLALFPRFSLSRFWGEVGAAKATIFGAYANVMRLLLNAEPHGGDVENPLRLAVIAGTDCESAAAFEKRFAVRIVDTYGMTEAEPVTLPQPGASSPTGSCGFPSPDFELRVLDDRGCEAAPGEQGEVVLRPKAPDVMFQGYVGDDAATVAAWKDLWFHTTDRGFIDEDGVFYFCGRGSERIQRGGENVSAHEVDLIASRHPAVAQAAAVAVPSPLGGDDVKLVVVVKDGHPREPRSIHAYCQRSMARFMVPRYIEFIDALPTTDVGKVDRRALAASNAAAWDSASDRSPTVGV
jgi:carnitine-CoA ligase